MKQVVKISVGFVVLIAITGMTEVYAQDGTVRIQHYTHVGCNIDGQHYLPNYTSSGLVATFKAQHLPHQCLDMIARAQASCEWAREFKSTNPDGHTWSPGEKDPRCFDVFRNEVPRCIEYYEVQKPKCNQQSDTAAVKEQEREKAQEDRYTVGSVTYENGDHYEGGLHNGLPHGRGTIIYADGSRYDGEFRHGNRYDGMLTYADGSQIEFRSGERIGTPTASFTNPDGSHYDGEVLNGLPHGDGKMTWPNGVHLEGEWRKGQLYRGDYQDGFGKHNVVYGKIVNYPAKNYVRNYVGDGSKRREYFDDSNSSDEFWSVLAGGLLKGYVERKLEVESGGHSAVSSGNAHCEQIGERLARDLEKVKNNPNNGMCQIGRGMAQALIRARKELVASNCASSRELENWDRSIREAQATAKASCEG